MLKATGSRWLLGLALAATATLGVVSTACGDGKDDDYNTGVILAIDIMDKAGLHDIATTISERGEIPATARTTALRLQTLVALTEWPSELRSEAEALEPIFADMAKALDGDKPDLKVAAAAAKKAHDAEHDFSGKVWDYLSEEADTSAGTAAHKD